MFRVIRLGALLVWGALLARDASAQTPPRLDPSELAAKIDRRLEQAFASAGIQPAPLADDAEFFRRLNLDIAGRIPRPGDIHAFLADKSPAKRRQAIDQLLAEPRYAVHFANVWRAELLPEIASNPAALEFKQGFEAWLRLRFRSGIGYDKIVTELLTVPLPADKATAEPVLRDPSRPN